MLYYILIQILCFFHLLFRYHIYDIIHQLNLKFLDQINLINWTLIFFMVYFLEYIYIWKIIITFYIYNNILILFTCKY
jgi:hypothetical protein